MTPEHLLQIIDDRMVELGSLSGQTLTHSEVSRQIGVHPAAFSRLKSGQLPGNDTLEKLRVWVGHDFDCYDEDTTNGDDDADGGPYAIIGIGSFSETDNEDVQALIGRAKELLTEGAVGVSIATDLNPDDLPDDLDPEDEAFWDAVAEAGIRPRHVAIVDTAAFSDARLSLNDDGTVSGPVAYEGQPTGDLRILPSNSLDWSDILPIPILFDIQDGDHTGTVVGSITELRRVPIDEQPTNASTLAPAVVPGIVDQLPAKAFAKPPAEPLTITEPKADGLRRVYGIVAPPDVCHRSPAYKGCKTYRGASLDYVHSGSPVTLDDGTRVRVASLRHRGLHPGLDSDATSAEHSGSVWATVRFFDTPKGLLASGVVMPDVSEADVMRLRSIMPSVELRPDHRNRLELRGVLMVPQGGWPSGVNSSAVDGDALVPVVERLDRVEAALALLVGAMDVD